MLPNRDIEFVRNDPETAKTQLVIVVGILLLAAIFDDEHVAYFSLFLGLLMLIIPPAGNWIVWGWYKLAVILSQIVNPIVLGLLYFLFITPIALMFRLFGNDPLDLKKPRGSVFDYHEKTYSKKDLEKPW
ncbi:MAG: hypothetical protein JJ895_01625 [Balneolaceae bacterium]|nr:hypothetical protein [Balneolaceae bacterium]